MVKITKDEELKAWLKGQEQRTHCAFAARAAARVLPLAINQIDAAVGGNRGVDFTLATLRAVLISRVAGTSPTREISGEVALPARSANSAALLAARSAAARTALSAANSANSAANSANSAASSANSFLSANAAALSALSATRSVVSGASFANYGDAEALDSLDPEKIFETKLWQDDRKIGNLTKMWERFRDRDDPDKIWSFWVEWYASLLNGDPMDWELQKRVALIPDDVWKEGAAAVAAEIEKIKQKYELESRIEELESAIMADSQTLRGMGDNNPPSPIEEAPAIAEPLLVIWKPLQDLKSEVKEDNPSVPLIKAALEGLEAGLLSICKWIGRKADLAVDKSIHWGIPLAGGYAVTNPDKVQELIDMVRTMFGL